MISARSAIAVFGSIGAAVLHDCSALLPTEFGTTAPYAPRSASAQRAASVAGARSITVSGVGTDGLTTAVVHSTKATPTGMIRTSTEIIELSGDLKGRVLYHVTTVLDTVRGTLVNTGDQVYSGTVAGSAPVMLHDDRFHFEVDLKTGQERGRVYLLDRIAGPNVRCTLDVVGTGLNAQGNPTFTYRGACTFAEGRP
ncbi:hypothetical protein J421_5900 (plasmid) [Gemmatirosa kalamazoonensis]|uniref:Uncharacterized protein n=1 Tax=Gemmatirosa kalamazoonensis TaxID=861299 RepID=W0RSZ1_9BACT|nr:hypothetical protein [Gemmatirosa kalamazoonensis]AHG93435.1 hypothetical protein J421_5900 [Gemmatirosa kalamazoonensis]